MEKRKYFSSTFCMLGIAIIAAAGGIMLGYYAVLAALGLAVYLAVQYGGLGKTKNKD